MPDNRCLKCGKLTNEVATYVPVDLIPGDDGFYTRKVYVCECGNEWLAPLIGAITDICA